MVSDVRSGLAAAIFVSIALPALADTPPTNPFAAFYGEWTLKDDRFQQVWDGETVETLTIPNHYTRCDPINTAGSVLCVVDAGDLKGHILWSIDRNSEQVSHQSHFGTHRLGIGTGSLNASDDLNLKIAFADEPSGTYRIYDYEWINADAYTMMSKQYDADGIATGNWYGGTFVRLSAEIDK